MAKYRVGSGIGYLVTDDGVRVSGEVHGIQIGSSREGMIEATINLVAVDATNIPSPGDTATLYYNAFDAANSSWDTMLDLAAKENEAWQKIRQNVESGEETLHIDGNGCRYWIRKVDVDYPPKENEMRIYKLNVVNRRTREYKEFVIPVFAPNGSDAIKQGLLVNAEAINRMGDTSEIEVWVDEKWKFEPIDEKSD